MRRIVPLSQTLANLAIIFGVGYIVIASAVYQSTNGAQAKIDNFELQCKADGGKLLQIQETIGLSNPFIGTIEVVCVDYNPDNDVLLINK